MFAILIKSSGRWITDDPATEGPEAGYSVIGSLYRYACRAVVAASLTLALIFQLSFEGPVGGEMWKTIISGGEGGCCRSLTIFAGPVPAFQRIVNGDSYEQVWMMI